MSAGPDADLATLFAAARAEYRPEGAQWASLKDALTLRLAASSAEPVMPHTSGAGRSGSRPGPFHRQLNPARLRIGGLWGAGLLVVGAAWLLARSGPNSLPSSAVSSESAAVALESRAAHDAHTDSVAATALDRAFAVTLPLSALQQLAGKPLSAIGRGGSRHQQVQPQQVLSLPVVASAQASTEAAAAHVPDDGPLLRDLVKLSRVEASLRSGNPRQALSLLDAAGVERLFHRATALRARASCLLGMREQGLQLLAQVPSSGEASSARALAEQACNAKR